MLKRDLSYDLFSRELQALDELFSREPEGWAEYMAKREPSPGEHGTGAGGKGGNKTKGGTKPVTNDKGR